MSAQNKVKLVELYTSWALTKALQADKVVLVGAEGEASASSKQETTESQNTIFMIQEGFKGKKDWKKHSSHSLLAICQNTSG